MVFQNRQSGCRPGMTFLCPHIQLVEVAKKGRKRDVLYAFVRQDRRKRCLHFFYKLFV